MVAMEIAEDRLESHHALAIEGHIHAEDAVGGRVVRAQGDFEEFVAFFRNFHDGRRISLESGGAHAVTPDL
jgi:hypothetical protein